MHLELNFGKLTIEKIEFSKPMHIIQMQKVTFPVTAAGCCMTASNIASPHTKVQLMTATASDLALKI